MSEPRNPSPEPENVEVIDQGHDPSARWQPVVGPETLSALGEFDGLDPESRQRVRDEAIAVLRSCIPPESPDATETGLVVGQVQSGKTMSFTTVAALAGDNGFPLVIIITGTSNPLTGQSQSRLQKDLRLLTRSDRAWRHFANPRMRSLHAIQAILEDWRDPTTPQDERQTVLITVMKNHQHLRHLNDILAQLPLNGVPALVIDDEADQAGLNNLVRQGQESTTYRRLLALRRALPHHTYLQYTATPQAPLLINMIDVLSPRFAELLTPGQDYVGGEELFVQRQDIIRDIPANEIPSPAAPLHDPPPTLLEAMQIFFLGVAAGWQTREGNRSMMVHPSQQTLHHAEYVQWIRETRLQWQHLFSLSPGDPDRQALVKEFELAYRDLHSTVPDLPPLQELVDVLPRAMRKTEIIEVNAVGGHTPEPDWRAAYSHILVGGRAMERGFTVEGLTVTYMPRGIGGGNADAIQQRARFLGYKRQYLGFCRVYLGMAGRGAYRSYVEHEEDVRARLATHRATGKPLTDWKRAFFLDLALQPTRRSVLDLDYMRDQLADDWYTPKAPHESEEAVASNREVVRQFLATLQLQSVPGHEARSAFQSHDVADRVSLSSVFTELLTRLRVTRSDDSQRFTGLLLQIREYLDANPDAVCCIYHMSPSATRTRSLNDLDEISNLFQGADPVNPPERRGSIYPGDMQMKAPQGLTVQIHNLNLTTERGGQVIRTNVPTAAVWVPREMARSWLVQEEAS